jgi:alpha-D-ribose 1-methylphosphonate 5-triphosphate synthase subunit PhnH
MIDPFDNHVPFLPGFLDPVLDSQYTFRRVLKAMAHPARQISLEIEMQVPPPLYRTTGAICLTLLDLRTPVWLDPEERGEVAPWLRFHCGCPLVPFPSNARFGLIFRGEAVPPLHQFNLGEDEFPEGSATLIIQVKGFTSGIGKIFRGPGIKTTERLAVHGLSNEFWNFWGLNHRLYPLGVDVLFASDSAVVGLPRTIQVTE